MPRRHRLLHRRRVRQRRAVSRSDLGTAVADARRAIGTTTARPFIFVSPQNDVPPFSTIEWDLDELDAFFQFIVDNYPVDPRRMYLTGMSQGGRGVLQYINAHPRRFTAAAPMPGGRSFASGSAARSRTPRCGSFHGEDDNNANLGPACSAPARWSSVEHMYENPDLYPADQPASIAAQASPPPAGPDDDVLRRPVTSSWYRRSIRSASASRPRSGRRDQGCGIAADCREYSAANDADGIYSWFLAIDRPEVVAPDDLEVPGDRADSSSRRRSSTTMRSRSTGRRPTAPR